MNVRLNRIVDLGRDAGRTRRILLTLTDRLASLQGPIEAYTRARYRAIARERGECGEPRAQRPVRANCSARRRAAPCLVEALAEFRKFFLLAPLQFLQRFLVMATAGVARGEMTSYRQG